jgi:hypothetical protein
LSFLDVDDSDHDDDDEGVKEKEALCRVLRQALASQETREAENRWIRVWFGGKWALPLLWARASRAMRTRGADADLAYVLLNTLEWLLSAWRHYHDDFDEDPVGVDDEDGLTALRPADLTQVLLRDVLKSITPINIISTSSSSHQRQTSAMWACLIPVCRVSCVVCRVSCVVCSLSTSQPRR